MSNGVSFVRIAIGTRLETLIGLLGVAFFLALILSSVSTCPSSSMISSSTLVFFAARRFGSGESVAPATASAVLTSIAVVFLVRFVTVVAVVLAFLLQLADVLTIDISAGVGRLSGGGDSDESEGDSESFLAMVYVVGNGRLIIVEVLGASVV